MTDQINENVEEFDDIITLYDEDNNEVQCEFIDYIEYDGNEYIIMLPLDEPTENSEVIILEVKKLSEDEEEYLTVEDEDVLNDVYDLFKEKYQDEFNFAD